MAVFSLREAAVAARTSKSTIWRAVKSGRMSATRLDDGGFAIDASELFRAFPPQQAAPHAEGQTATAAEASHKPGTRGGTDELAVRLAAFEAEIAGLKALLDEVRQSREEARTDREQLRVDRDGWRERAERLLTRPETPSLRPWWRRLAG